MALDYETIRLTVEDGIATLTLDRPERLNAFTHQMLLDLVDALDCIDADPEARCVVLTGSGRGFCAGADLEGGGRSAFARGDGDLFRYPENADGGGILTRRIYDLAKPVIAAINGPAVGVGLTMTLAADVRMVSTEARLGFVFARRGLVPEAASSFFLPRLVGISRAAEWVYTGRIFGADEALEAGLVRSVHAPDELLDAATVLAVEMSEGTSRVAVALARRMLWQMYAEGTPELAHRLDSEGMFGMSRAADVEEGVASFLEKREPEFALRVPDDLPDYYRRWGRERGGFDPDVEDAGEDLQGRLR
jgi:enoyl-CoA hydratase/carnithine racemase